MRPENSVRSIILLSVISLLLAGCQQGIHSGSGGVPSGTGGGKHKLAFVTNNASDFWTIARKGTEKAAAEIAGIEVEFRIPSDGTAAEQQRVIDDLLAKGIHGIAISPVDPVNQTPMLSRAAGAAVVVTPDSDAPHSSRGGYPGT